MTLAAGLAFGVMPALADETVPSQHLVPLERAGTTTFAGIPTSAPASLASATAAVPDAADPLGPAAGVAVPKPDLLPVALDDVPQGWLGLTHQDQRLADGGNQLDVEPASPALCVGPGHVVQLVNSAIAVWNKADGGLIGETSLNRFLGQPSRAIHDAVVPGLVAVYGPELSNPQCMYDPVGGRFVVTVQAVEVDAVTGLASGRTSLLLAVTQTADPTQAWAIFRLPTTNDGLDPGLPVAHPGCPCVGRHPRLGLDANGVYLTTDEHTASGAFFNGAQLYAMSRTLLEAAALDPALPVPVVLVDGLRLGRNLASGVQPAVVPPGGTTSDHFGGTALLVSDAGQHTRDAPIDLGTQRGLAVWALRHTASLTDPVPSLALHVDIVATQRFAQPPPARQLDGPRLLASFIAESQGVPMPPVGPIGSGDSRISGPVTYAAGHLFAAANTAIENENGRQRVGIAWWIIDPNVGIPEPPAVRQEGYVAVQRGSVLYPAIAVNAAGTGAMTFTLVNSKLHLFPSAAYALLDASGFHEVRVAAAGASPQDGRSEYAVFGLSPAWGRYSAAAVDAGDGSAWLATTYIPDAPRTLLANWGTRVLHVAPPAP